MKSSGEPGEEQQIPPSIDRNFKVADIEAWSLDGLHVFFHSVSDC